MDRITEASDAKSEFLPTYALDQTTSLDALLKVGNRCVVIPKMATPKEFICLSVPIVNTVLRDLKGYARRKYVFQRSNARMETSEATLKQTPKLPTCDNNNYYSWMNINISLIKYINLNIILLFKTAEKWEIIIIIIKYNN